jgi:hypothetical protein
MGSTARMVNVSDHKKRSMLLRYNIVTEPETADALPRAGCLSLNSTQPMSAENERDSQETCAETAAGSL